MRRRLQSILQFVTVSLLLTATSARSETPGVKLSTLRVRSDKVVGDVAGRKNTALTLNADAQRAAYKLLRDAHPLSGAAILLDAKTGEVVALASYKRRGASRGNPLVAGVPAASVFKLVTTTALFEHTDISPQTRVCFSGGEHQIDREHLEPPRPRDARCDTFGTALGYSRNAVYAQLATQHLMREELASTAERLGFNHRLQTPARARVGALELPYNDLEFARAAAGFIGSTLTPIGAAHLTWAIANGGRAAPLRIIADKDAQASESALYGQIMSENTAWRLTRMMEVTVHSGTSLDAFSNDQGINYLGGIRVAGKTGTLRRGANAPTTSWFTGFAPSRKPRYVVTVMLQNGKVWRRKANEVARDLLRYAFKDRAGVTDPFQTR